MVKSCWTGFSPSDSRRGIPLACSRLHLLQEVIPTVKKEYAPREKRRGTDCIHANCVVTERP